MFPRKNFQIKTLKEFIKNLEKYSRIASTWEKTLCDYGCDTENYTSDCNIV